MWFSPEGRLLLVIVTAHGEGPKLIDAQTGELVHEFPSVRQRHPVFSPDGRNICSISDAVAEGGVTYDGGGGAVAPGEVPAER